MTDWRPLTDSDSLQFARERIKSLEDEVANLKSEVERLRKYHKLHEDHFDKVCETLSHPHYHADANPPDEQEG